MVVVSLFGTKAILPSVVNCSAGKTSDDDSDYKQFEDNKPESRGDDEGGVIGALKSLLNPNETAKSRIILPQAYLKSAEDAKTLRKSLKEDSKDMEKLRTADSDKLSIRDYLIIWRGKTTIASQESHVMLEKAIRIYAKAGPSAPLLEEIKSEILHVPTKAEEFL